MVLKVLSMVITNPLMDDELSACSRRTVSLNRGGEIVCLASVLYLMATKYNLPSALLDGCAVTVLSVVNPGAFTKKPCISTTIAMLKCAQVKRRIRKWHKEQRLVHFEVRRCHA